MKKKPHFVTVRFLCICSETGRQLIPGDKAYYIPARLGSRAKFYGVESNYVKGLK